MAVVAFEWTGWGEVVSRGKVGVRRSFCDRVKRCVFDVIDVKVMMVRG
jgi:hypothetical protein